MLYKLIHGSLLTGVYKMSTVRFGFVGKIVLYFFVPFFKEVLIWVL